MEVNRKSWVWYWLPPLIWMLAISLFSTDHFSSQQTSRIIGPLLRFFIPDIGDATISDIQFYIRKAGHIIEYAILLLLWYRAFHRNDPHPFQVWQFPRGWYCLALCILFAGFDEWHQTWTQHRTGSPIDVGLDGLGASAALGWVYRRSFSGKKK